MTPATSSSVSLASSTAASAAGTLAFEQLRPLVEEALNHYHNADAETLPLAELLAFQQERKVPHRSLHQVTNRVLLHAWEELQQRHPADADFIEKRFFDRETMQSIAAQRHISEGYIYKFRTQALDRLTTTLLAQDAALRAEQQRSWLARLDTATYTELFGVEEIRQTLYDIVTQAGPPWLLQLEGIGGSGKTSLADAVTRDVIATGPFAEIAWVSVQPAGLTPVGVLVPRSTVEPTLEGLLRALVRQLVPTFPLTAESTAAQLLAALHTPLKTFPHLIVLDNLEAITDRAALATVLEQLANPSRFLLTSRVEFPTMQPLFRLTVPPLSQAAALTLLRQEATWGNLPAVATAHEAQLLPIYATVGGNPLALRLVIGLAHHHALATIVERLQVSNDHKIDQLYRFLFAEGWQALNAASRGLLLFMPLAHSRGETVAWIAAATDSSEADVITALDPLVALNLVNVHRDRQPFRYSVHQLTRTFLLNDAINWRT